MLFTPDEFMVVCISRNIQDGETVVQGLSTPLVAAGYLLARRTHAPNIYFASAIGQSMCKQPAPLSVAHVESLWLGHSLKNIGFSRVATQVLPTLRPKEYFRPAQVDPFGNTNNIAFGKNYLSEGHRHSRMRLPGSAGIPDVTTFISRSCLYVPRHSKLTFVPRLDVASGMGYLASRKQGQGPIYLITDLGQFDFADGRMRLTTFHPSITPEYIQSRTGFDLAIAPDLHETLPPTDEEIRLLREEIDPLNIRQLELLSGAPRRQLLREILAKEQ
jgi:acyl CoA:acetate/3-ketoacid CoA transferase beta subunit